MTDLHRLPEDREAEHFWPAQKQRVLELGTTPEQCCEAAEKPSRVGWMIWPALVALALFSLWLLKVATANASEPRKQPVYVIWNETTNAQAHVHQFSSPTACNTDIGGVAKTTPDGSRLSCRRIDQRKEQ